LEPYFHVALVVEDLAASMGELTAALGVRWDEPHDSRYGEWSIRVVYSLDPPFIELVQGEPGSPWDTSAGPRLDHIGYFSDDVLADSARLEAAEVPIDFDPAPYGRGGAFAYHRAPSSGLRIELVTSAGRAQRYARGSMND
jgi:hypothetical protein